MREYCPPRFSPPTRPNSSRDPSGPSRIAEWVDVGGLLRRPVAADNVAMMSDNPYQSPKQADSFSPQRMTVRLAFTTIIASAAIFAVIGGAIGYALGTFAPGYYRGVFSNGNEPGFDPVSVGLGQGITQGVTGGAAIGLLVIAILVWRECRIRRPS